MTGDEDGRRITVDVQRGAPSPDELAALIAVVTEAYTREAEEAVADESPVRSTWSVTQRSLREPLRRDLGWR